MVVQRGSFDGKIGIWPFVEYEQAQRRSKHRDKGTVEMKSVSCTAEAYYEMHVKPFGVIEAIVDKMPWLCGPGKHIYVQHDGAAPHTGGGNNELLNLEGQLEDETCIHYIMQPAQSPDMNKNDLSFFNSLSCRAEELKRGVKTLEELISNVEKAYWDYPREILERINVF